MMTRNWMLWVGGIILGATAGYMYWYFIGCVSGTCPITSSPVNSTLYGSVMGGLLVNTFRDAKKKK
jgi:hypothetical protein